jgi:protein ImuB
MIVPSYDDLTPGIPDVSDTRLDAQLALFLESVKTPNAQRPTPKQLPTDNSQTLYACLRAASSAEKLAEIARDFSPRIMRVSDSEVLLDVSGLGRLIGEPAEIARQLARAMYDMGLTARVALAPTQTMARLIAAAPASDFYISTFPNFQISHLPVSLLQPLEALPPAMNHRDRARPYETFQRWGIATLADLAALPVADVSSRLGRRGVALHRLARGLDPKPFVPDGETPRFIGRLELEWPIDALEPLSFVFARLLEPLSASLERADRGAAAIHLELRLTDRSTDVRLLQLPAPMRDARVLRTLLLLDLESHPPSPATAAVDIVSIELDPAPARITQFSLLQRALPSPETVSTLTARLAALVGESRIGSPVLIDTHEPGAFQMRRYAPEKGAEGAEGAKGAEGAVLRRQRHPPAIRVSVEHGRPVHLASSKRGMPHGAVTQAAGPWRTSGGWWSGPWSHDEWDVALTSGTVCRIYQDRTTERWFLEGIYD